MNRSLTQTHPNVWRLIADNPSPMTGPGTNTYLVGQRRVVIIDPGPDDLAHQNNIAAALTTLGATAQAIIITHHHRDHAGGAATLADRLQVPLLGPEELLDPPEQEIAVNGVRAEIRAEVRLVIKHTPGHIQAHLCLWQPAQRLLFAADLVAGAGTILIIPPDGDMAAYLDSLAAMKALNPAAILPGHGPVIDDPQALLQAYIDHRLMRERQVLDCVNDGWMSARQIAEKLYADRPPEVLGIAALQIEAHLDKLRREGQIG
ncbi:MAG: MBL fold metallo-hydrolase [Anaerolineae bacterium]|nr:MBL fold metallo-hydrolase [Anaerolineae bacterium]